VILTSWNLKTAATPSVACSPVRWCHTYLQGARELIAEWLPPAAYYTARSAHFEHLQVASGASEAPGYVLDPSDVQRAALHAAERGEVRRLLTLAEVMLDSQGRTDNALGRRVAAYSERSALPELARPFPSAVTTAARDLGFRAVLLKPYGRISAYLSRHAWHPSSFAHGHVMRDGASSASLTADELQLRPGVPEPLRDVLALFVLHPYVSSAGTRYVPPLLAEQVLIEDFDEAAEPPAAGPLLAALGLERRRALARSQIDSALLERGPQVLDRLLGVDPLEYQLVCVPFDVYTRVGRERGWGRPARWTHFDGYQVLRDGHLLALVGGDVRYGGLYDLCGIGRTDQREGVIARFAVVRRARLAARAV